MAEKIKKRYRNVNYTKEEVCRLLGLVDKRKEIIDSKVTDGKMSKYKTMQWNIIEGEYNIKSDIKRKAKELRYKYDSLKKGARKKAASGKQIEPYWETATYTATGRAPAILALPDNSHERVGELIKCEPSVDYLPTDPDSNDIFPNEPEDSQSPEQDITEESAQILMQQFTRAHPRPSQQKNPQKKYKILYATRDPSVVARYSPSLSSSSEDVTTSEGASIKAAYIDQKIEALKQELAARIEAHSMNMKFAEEKHCLEMEVKRAELTKLKKEIVLKDLEIQIKKENCKLLEAKYANL